VLWFQTERLYFLLYTGRLWSGLEIERVGRLDLRKVRIAFKNEYPSRLVKRCHNQANVGPRKAGKALERKKERKKDHAKLIKRCHNQANNGLRNKERKKDHAKLTERCINQAS
jgi:hypothetical protein